MFQVIYYYSFTAKAAVGYYQYVTVLTVVLLQPGNTFTVTTSGNYTITVKDG
jgi:hypothetical protein